MQTNISTSYQTTATKTLNKQSKHFINQIKNERLKTQTLLKEIPKTKIDLTTKLTFFPQKTEKKSQQILTHKHFNISYKISQIKSTKLIADFGTRIAAAIADVANVFIQIWNLFKMYTYVCILYIFT